MSPKTKKQYEEIRRKSTETIKEVALGLFARNGYHSTSISKIAREAGVSKGLMYNYFEGKEALLEAIITDAFEEGEETMIPYLVNQSEPRAQLRGLTEATFHMVQERFDYWKLLTALSLQPGVLAGMEPIIKQKQAELMPKFIQLFAALGADDPEKAAYLYGAVLDGVLLNYFQMGEEYPLEAMKDYILLHFNLIDTKNKQL